MRPRELFRATCLLIPAALLTACAGETVYRCNLPPFPADNSEAALVDYVIAVEALR